VAGAASGAGFRRRAVRPLAVAPAGSRASLQAQTRAAHPAATRLLFLPRPLSYFGREPLRLPKIAPAPYPNLSGACCSAVWGGCINS
jgi:hypothetical protein